MLQFDHLAIAAETLEAGRDAVELALGVSLEPGGEHPVMGTHNLLLSLGEDAYLEVIARNPAAPDPRRPRWFALDDFAGPPRPGAWVLRADDLAAALAGVPFPSGPLMAFERAAYRWQMTVPDNGYLPFDGLFPALIGWQGKAHPAAALRDQGVRLRRLRLVHPAAHALSNALAPLFRDPRLVIEQGVNARIEAAFDTPHGPRVLA